MVHWKLNQERMSLDNLQLSQEAKQTWGCTIEGGFSGGFSEGKMFFHDPFPVHGLFSYAKK